VRARERLYPTVFYYGRNLRIMCNTNGQLLRFSGIEKIETLPALVGITSRSPGSSEVRHERTHHTPYRSRFYNLGTDSDQTDSFLRRYSSMV